MSQPSKNYSCCTFVGMFYHAEDLLNLHSRGNETQRLKWNSKVSAATFYKIPNPSIMWTIQSRRLQHLQPIFCSQFYFFAGQAAQLTRCLRLAGVTAKTKALLDLWKSGWEGGGEWVEPTSGWGCFNSPGEKFQCPL